MGHVVSWLERESLLAALAAKDLAERLIVTPLLDGESQVGPGSIDLRLGSTFIEVRRRAGQGIDPFHPDSANTNEEHYEVPFGESLVLHPGQFMLGSTFEFIRLPPAMAGQVLGRSSWGRLGLIVATAVAVQPGFAGSLTLELQNLGPVPISLYPGLRVAQLVVWSTAEPTAAAYGGDAKYESPLGPESSRIGWETAELDRLRKIGRSLKGMPAEPADDEPGDAG